VNVEINCNRMNRVMILREAVGKTIL